MTHLSIIIVNHNTKDLLQKCLLSIFNSLKSATFTYEVFVVDNASTDGSVQMIKHHFPMVSVIINKKNVGFGRANNQAAKKAQGEYLLFLNSDTEVLGKGVESLYNFILQRNNIIAGGKLFNPNGTVQPSCGYFYTLPVVFGSLFLKADQLKLTRFSPNKITETDWVSGACLMIRKETFNKLDGFDESIFMYMDEVDLCFRAKLKKIPVVFYPQACFIHMGSASSKDKRAPYVNLFKGLAYFYKKHFPKKLIFLKFLLKTKALLAISLGLIIKNQSLVSNYKKAWRLIKKED